MGTDHKGRIETDPELADNLDVFFILHFLFKFKGTALGNRAQVIFQFLFCHTAAIVGNGQRSFFFIRKNPDHKIIAVQTGFSIRQRLIIQFVYCIACVGDQFPEKNFLMRVNGINH